MNVRLCQGTRVRWVAGTGCCRECVCVEWRWWGARRHYGSSGAPDDVGLCLGWALDDRWDRCNGLRGALREGSSEKGTDPWDVLESAPHQGTGEGCGAFGVRRSWRAQCLGVGASRSPRRPPPFPKPTPHPDPGAPEYSAPRNSGGCAGSRISCRKGPRSAHSPRRGVVVAASPARTAPL